MKKLFPLYKYCQEHDFPVVFHTGILAAGSPGILKQVHPLNIDEVANQFPDLKIVMAHMGNPWIADCAVVVAKNPNVYTDLSVAFPEYEPITQEEVDIFKRKIQEYKDFAGNLNKCLFGTDYPLYSQKEYLAAVQQLKMTKEEKELVFWKNAVTIFHIPKSINLKRQYHYLRYCPRDKWAITFAVTSVRHASLPDQHT